MSSPRQVIAIGNYDFRPSGTVAKSIEIATSAAAAGLPVELWVMRAKGPLLERVPDNVPVVEIGWHGWSARARSLDLPVCILALGRALRKCMPSVFLSGGNHLHLAAKFAMAVSGGRKATRFGLRASNSSYRPDAATGRIIANASFWDRFKYKGADFVVAVSNDLAMEIRRADPSLNVQCIPNGVDVERIRRLALEPFDHPFVTGGDDSRPVLVTMGRISRQKGYDILIRALACLPPRIRARLLVIGDGSETEIGKLRGLARELGVAQDIDFLGYRANPFAVMSKSDLFVSASRWEGASNALNEALVCGLPLVVTDCPTGNRDVLKEGRFGTLAPVENPPALAQAIVAELSAERRSRAPLSTAEDLDLRTYLDKWVELLAFHHQAAMAGAEVSDLTVVPSALRAAQAIAEHLGTVPSEAPGAPRRSA